METKSKLQKNEVVDEVIEDYLAEKELGDPIDAELPAWLKACVALLHNLYSAVGDITGYHTRADYVVFRMTEIAALWRQRLSQEFKNDRVGFKAREKVYRILDEMVPLQIAALCDVAMDGTIAAFRARGEMEIRLRRTRRLLVLVLVVGVVGWIL
jgi:hypothetical protein